MRAAPRIPARKAAGSEITPLSDYLRTPLPLDLGLGHHAEQEVVSRVTVPQNRLYVTLQRYKKFILQE